MSDVLEFHNVNASEAYDRYGFMLGGKAIKLDEPQEPVSPEPMSTQRRAVRLSQPYDREPDLTPAVQKTETLSLDNIDLSDLERWLSGDPDPEPEPVQEPEQEPFYKMPTTVELDRRPDFHDLLLASYSGCDVKQREPEHSFVNFLRQHHAERHQAILDAIARLDAATV